MFYSCLSLLVLLPLTPYILQYAVQLTLSILTTGHEIIVVNSSKQ